MEMLFQVKSDNLYTLGSMAKTDLHTFVQSFVHWCKVSVTGIRLAREIHYSLLHKISAPSAPSQWDSWKLFILVLPLLPTFHPLKKFQFRIHTLLSYSLYSFPPFSYNAGQVTLLEVCRNIFWNQSQQNIIITFDFFSPVKSWTKDLSGSDHKSSFTRWAVQGTGNIIDNNSSYHTGRHIPKARCLGLLWVTVTDSVLIF